MAEIQKEYKHTKLNELKIMSKLRTIHVKELVENMVKAKISELGMQNSICKFLTSIHEVDIESQLFWRTDTQKLREPEVLLELLKYIIVKSENHKLVFFVDVIKLAYPVEKHASMNYVSIFFEIDDPRLAFKLELRDKTAEGN